VLPTLHHDEYTSFSTNELIKIKTLESICSNVTLGFQLSASRIGSILSLSILSLMIITPLTENGESNTFALSFNYSGNSSEMKENT
jgi:hypothetical protein